METTTRENLLRAMKGEAFAFAKYMLFARRSRAEANYDAATLFEQVALEERFEHFTELAELYGLVGTTEENLTNAISGENEEVHHTYADFEEQARQAGDTVAADRFSELRKDEAAHENKFRRLLGEIAMTE